jgi:hypothetical protein
MNRLTGGLRGPLVAPSPVSSLLIRVQKFSERGPFICLSGHVRRLTDSEAGANSLILA